MARKKKSKKAAYKGWRRSYASKKYIHYRKSGVKRPKARYHKASIRTVGIGRHGRKLLVGCPKRCWRPRKKRCSTGLQAFAMLVPRGYASKRNPHPAVVARSLADPQGLCSIGQLSRTDIAALEKAVRAGILQKGKGGPYPTPKTVYAHPSIDLAKERQREIDLMMMFSQKRNPARNPKSATAISLYMELVEKGLPASMAASIARRRMLPFYSDYLTIARLEKSIISRGNVALRLKRARQEKQGARPVKPNDRARYPVWWKVYFGLGGRARAAMKFPHDPALAMSAARRIYPEAALRLKRVDDGLEIGGAEDGLEEELE